MNSLPLISHRLFVAAIGNEGHVPERPRRQEKPAVELDDQGTSVALEVMGGARPITHAQIRSLRASPSQARA
jgi:hypothetical protein